MTSPGLLRGKLDIMQLMLIGVLLHAIPLRTTAQTNPEARTLRIQGVFEVSGLNRQLQFLPALMEIAILDEQETFGDEKTTRLLRAMKAAYHPGQIQDAALGYFQEHYEDARLAGVSGMFNTPVARKMLELEAAASNPDETADIMAYAESLQTHPPSPSRVARLRAFDAAIRYKEFMVEAYLTMVRAVFDANDSTLMSVQRMPEHAVSNMVDTRRGRIEERMAAMISVDRLYTYKDATDDDLAQYTVLWNSDAGQWFVRMKAEAQRRAITVCNSRMVREMMSDSGNTSILPR